MDTGNVIVIFIGIVIISIATGFEYTMIRGFQTLGAGIIILSLVDVIIGCTINKNT